jgi:hypothetical protein
MIVAVKVVVRTIIVVGTKTVPTVIAPIFHAIWVTDLVREIMVRALLTIIIATNIIKTGIMTLVGHNYFLIIHTIIVLTWIVPAIIGYSSV